MAETTRQKVKVVGTETYINSSTGEMVVMNVTSVEERDFNFTKVWMKDFITKLEIVGNQKMKVALWIIDNINRENMLIGTYRDIAEKTKTCYQTVAETMQALLQSDFLRKANNAVYMINPNVIYKGSYNGRMNVLTVYRDTTKTDSKPISKQEQLDNLLKLAENTQKQIAKLTREIAENDKTDIPGQMNIADYPEALPHERRA